MLCRHTIIKSFTSKGFLGCDPNSRLILTRKADEVTAVRVYRKLFIKFSVDHTFILKMPIRPSLKTAGNRIFAHAIAHLPSCPVAGQQTPSNLFSATVYPKKLSFLQYPGSHTGLVISSSIGWQSVFVCAQKFGIVKKISSSFNKSV